MSKLEQARYWWIGITSKQRREAYMLIYPDCQMQDNDFDFMGLINSELFKIYDACLKKSILEKFSFCILGTKSGKIRDELTEAHIFFQILVSEQ